MPYIAFFSNFIKTNLRMLIFDQKHDFSQVFIIYSLNTWPKLKDTKLC